MPKLESVLKNKIDRNVYLNAMLGSIRDEEAIFRKLLNDLDLLLTKDNTLDLDSELFYRDMNRKERKRLTSIVQYFYNYYKDVNKIKDKVVDAFHIDKKTGNYTECDINIIYRDHIYTNHRYYEEFTLINEIKKKSAEIINQYERRIAKRLNEILQADYWYFFKNENYLRAVNGCYYNAERRRWTLLIAARPSEIREVQNLKLWKLQKALESVNDEYGTAISYRVD
ncbi:hypothetical protein P4575_27815 [Priestia megaterium]|uniref:hypothetical protein n=1 Tax=Priestia megaterium TaxID=1404 RepID=UPI002E1A8470|nr:hypothetical protein [Priestia megaterium]